jgi:hypothetical protein
MKTKLFYVWAVLFFSFNTYGQQPADQSMMDKIINFNQYKSTLQYRQPATVMARLDSVIHKNYDINNAIYNLNNLAKNFYDNNNKPTQVSNNNWDIANSVIMEQNRTDYTYDANGYLQTVTSYYYDANIGSIVPSVKFLYSFDTNGQFLQIVSKNYDTATSQFVNNSKEVYAYAQATDPKPNSVNTYIWDIANNVWIDSQRYNMTYNANFYLLTIVYENYNVSGSIWENMQKIVRTYDVNDFITTNIYQNWDVTTNAWVNFYKNIYTYSNPGSNLMIERSSLSWDTFANAWVLQNLLTNTFDSNNNLLLQTMEMYDTDQVTVVYGSKSEVSYNGNDSIILEYYWNAANQTWETNPYFKYMYTYDMTVPGSNIIKPSTPFINNIIYDTNMPFTYEPFHHKLLTVKYFNYNNNTNTFEETAKTTYKYTDTTTFVDKANQISTKVFPVPFNKFLKFEVEAEKFDLQITDLNGRLLHKGSYQNNEPVFLSNLTKGIYLYHIQTTDGEAIGKVIKK